MALCSPPNSPLPHRRVSELQGHFHLELGLLEGKVPEGGSAASVPSRASPQTLDSTALALSSFHGTLCAPTPVQASQAFSTIQHSHCETSPQLQGVGPRGCSLRVGTPQPLLYFLLLRRPEGVTGQVVAMLLLFTASYVREEDGLMFRLSPPV